MKQALEKIAAIRKFCGLVAVLLFFVYWPAANLYWVVCGAFGLISKAIGINSTIGGAFGIISMFMAFLVPIWALAVIGIYYLAATLAIASFRLVPLLLLSIAFLEKKRHIPMGHVGIDDVAKIYKWEFNNWLYPAMYSALAILSGILVLLSVRRKPDSYLR